jgi:hypothetical protein
MMHIDSLIGVPKMSKHARTTITVPADLKARMEAIDQEVNWSALACQAFEERLAEIVKTKGNATMEEAIARLRASKRRLESRQYQDGRGAGDRWAKDSAEAEELTRLAGWRQKFARDWNIIWADADGTATYASAETFVLTIRPDEDGDRQAAQEFWSHFIEHDLPDAEFVHGFADGALGVWDEVKDQL